MKKKLFLQKSKSFFNDQSRLKVADNIKKLDMKEEQNLQVCFHPDSALDSPEYILYKSTVRELEILSGKSS